MSSAAERVALAGSVYHVSASLCLRLQFVGAEDGEPSPRPGRGRFVAERVGLPALPDGAELVCAGCAARVETGVVTVCALFRSRAPPPGGDGNRVVYTLCSYAAPRFRAGGGSPVPRAPSSSPSPHAPPQAAGAFEVQGTFSLLAPPDNEAAAAAAAGGPVTAAGATAGGSRGFAIVDGPIACVCLDGALHVAGFGGEAPHTSWCEARLSLVPARAPATGRLAPAAAVTASGAGGEGGAASKSKSEGKGQSKGQGKIDIFAALPGAAPSWEPLLLVRVTA
eukprot:g4746.t1